MGHAKARSDDVAGGDGQDNSAGDLARTPAVAIVSLAKRGDVCGAAVDYRMTKTISVRAQLGTIGTGVDLLYQYRY